MAGDSARRAAETNGHGQVGQRSQIEVESVGKDGLARWNRHGRLALKRQRQVAVRFDRAPASRQRQLNGIHRHRIRAERVGKPHAQFISRRWTPARSGGGYCSSNPAGAAGSAVSVNCGDAPHVPTQGPPFSAATTVGCPQQRFTVRSELASNVTATGGTFFFMGKFQVQGFVSHL